MTGVLPTTTCSLPENDLAVVDEVITSLSDEYGTLGDMTVMQGKTHDYLGMTLDFSEEGKFIVNMKEYITEIPSEFP